MDLSNELRKLQELQENGTLTPDEFAQAKKAVLAQHDREMQSNHHHQQLQRQVKQLQRETDLLQIEREWEVERESYMMRGKGGLYVPARWHGITQACIWLGIGVVGLFAGGSPAIAIVVPLGLLFAIYTYLKAIDYENAYSMYEVRRQQCIERYQQSYRQR